MASAKGWDLSKYQAADLYRMAVTIEQGGYDFYDSIVEQSDNPRVKNEIKFLRDEEAQHKAFFQKQLGQKAGAQQGIAPELQALLEAEFLKPMEKLYSGKKISNNTEALRFGVEIEQKTIDFYGALKSGKADAAVRADLDRIIDEERKHKQKLNIILAY